MNYETLQIRTDKNCPKCSFSNLMKRQTHVTGKCHFLSSTVGQKSQNIVVTHPIIVAIP